MSLFTPRFIVSIGSLSIGLLAVIAYHCQVPEPFVAPNMELIKQYRSLNKSCFILGASGASGRNLLRELVRLQPFERIVLIGRRKLEFEDEELKKLEQRVVNFDEIEKYKKEFEGFDVGYSCLGGRRSKDGVDGFVKIEFDYVTGAAKLAKEGGTRHFHVVSSARVNANSWFLYYATKGRADRFVSELGFERTSIYKPAILLGRGENEFKEKLVCWVLKPITSLAPTLISVPVSDVAKAMVANTVLPNAPSGLDVVDNRGIHEMAKTIPE